MHRLLNSFRARHQSNDQHKTQTPGTHTHGYTPTHVQPHSLPQLSAQRNTQNGTIPIPRPYTTGSPVPVPFPAASVPILVDPIALRQSVTQAQKDCERDTRIHRHREIRNTPTTIQTETLTGRNTEYSAIDLLTCIALALHPTLPTDTHIQRAATTISFPVSCLLPYLTSFTDIHTASSSSSLSSLDSTESSSVALFTADRHQVFVQLQREQARSLLFAAQLKSQPEDGKQAEETFRMLMDLYMIEYYREQQQLIYSHRNKDSQKERQADLWDDLLHSTVQLVNKHLQPTLQYQDMLNPPTLIPCLPNILRKFLLSLSTSPTATDKTAHNYAGQIELTSLTDILLHLLLQVCYIAEETLFDPYYLLFTQQSAQTSQLTTRPEEEVQTLLRTFEVPSGYRAFFFFLVLRKQHGKLEEWRMIHIAIQTLLNSIENSIETSSPSQPHPMPMHHLMSGLQDSTTCITSFPLYPTLLRCSMQQLYQLFVMCEAAYRFHHSPIYAPSSLPASSTTTPLQKPDSDSQQGGKHQLIASFLPLLPPLLTRYDDIVHLLHTTYLPSFLVSPYYAFHDVSLRLDAVSMLCIPCIRMDDKARVASAVLSSLYVLQSLSTDIPNSLNSTNSSPTFLLPHDLSYLTNEQALAMELAVMAQTAATAQTVIPNTDPIISVYAQYPQAQAESSRDLLLTEQLQQFCFPNHPATSVSQQAVSNIDVPCSSSCSTSPVDDLGFPASLARDSIPPPHHSNLCFNFSFNTATGMRMYGCCLQLDCIREEVSITEAHTHALQKKPVLEPIAAPWGEVSADELTKTSSSVISSFVATFKSLGAEAEVAATTASRLSLVSAAVAPLSVLAMESKYPSHLQTVIANTKMNRVTSQKIQLLTHSASVDGVSSSSRYPHTAHPLSWPEQEEKESVSVPPAAQFLSSSSMAHNEQLLASASVATQLVDLSQILGDSLSLQDMKENDPLASPVDLTNEQDWNSSVRSAWLSEPRTQVSPRRSLRVSTDLETDDYMIDKPSLQLRREQSRAAALTETASIASTISALSSATQSLLSSPRSSTTTNGSEAPPSPHSHKPDTRPLQMQHVVCLLSEHPLQNRLKEALSSLPHTNDIELLMQSKPFSKLVQLTHTSVSDDSLFTPSTSTMPYMQTIHFPPLDFNFDALCSLLHPLHVIRLIEALVTEQRVLLVSSSYAQLNVIAHSLLACLYPFTWPHLFLPILPQSQLVSRITTEKCPYLMGIHRGAYNKDIQDIIHSSSTSSHRQSSTTSTPFTDLVVIDLDTDQFIVGSSPPLTHSDYCIPDTIKQFWLKQMYAIYRTEAAAGGDLLCQTTTPIQTCSSAPPPASSTALQLRIALVKGWCHLLCHYRSFVYYLPHTTQPSLIVDTLAFVRSKPYKYRAFLQKLVQSTSFRIFITERSNAATGLTAVKNEAFDRVEAVLSETRVDWEALPHHPHDSDQPESSWSVLTPATSHPYHFVDYDLHDQPSLVSK